jgi:hypothetical protein
MRNQRPEIVPRRIHIGRVKFINRACFLPQALCFGKPYGAVLSIDHHEPSAPIALAKRPPNVVKKRQKTGEKPQAYNETLLQKRSSPIPKNNFTRRHLRCAQSRRDSASALVADNTILPPRKRRSQSFHGLTIACIIGKMRLNLYGDGQSNYRDFQTETTTYMLNTMNAGWELMLKKLAAGLYRSRPCAAGPLVTFSLKRQKKLGWNLFLCRHNR